LYPLEKKWINSPLGKDKYLANSQFRSESFFFDDQDLSIYELSLTAIRKRNKYGDHIMYFGESSSTDPKPVYTNQNYMKFLSYSNILLKNLKKFDIKSDQVWANFQDSIKELDLSYSKIKLKMGFVVMPEFNKNNIIVNIKEYISLKLKHENISSACKNFLHKVKNF
jgi:hypothetical protein